MLRGILPLLRILNEIIKFFCILGVTGPYIAFASIGTFLVSKEYFVLEHEFYCGLVVFAVLNGIRLSAGQDMYNALKKQVDDQDAEYGKIRMDEINRCKDAIAEEENSQWMATSYQELIQAKKENVGLQLEMEYRTRLNEAYKQVSFIITKAYSSVY